MYKNLCLGGIIMLNAMAILLKFIYLKWEIYKILRSFLGFLIIILVSFVQCGTVSAESNPSLFKPGRGLYLLNNISQDEWYRTFCQVDGEVTSGSIDDPRVRGCHDAVKLIGDRLALMAMDSGYDVLDLEFLKSINLALFGGKDYYHYSLIGKGLVSAIQILSMKTAFSVRFSVGSALEAKQYAKDIYNYTGSEIYSWTFDDGKYSSILEPLKESLATAYHWLLGGEDNTTLKYVPIPVLYSFFRWIYPRADDWKTVQYLAALNFDNIYPISMRERGVEELAPTHVLGVDLDKLRKVKYPLTIYAAPSESHNPYFKQLMGGLYSSLEESTWNNHDFVFISLVKKMFLMHMFIDGNTRTTRLALNMLRLLSDSNHGSLT